MLVFNFFIHFKLIVVSIKITFTKQKVHKRVHNIVFIQVLKEERLSNEHCPL